MLAFSLTAPPSYLRSVINLKNRASHPRRYISMSLSTVSLSRSVDVHVVPILSDNFSYLLHDKKANVAAVVDPAEPEKLTSLAESLSARITTALITHHHWDHAGGNTQLASMVPGVEIVGSAYETAEGVNIKLESGDKKQINGSELLVTALRTPCHTMGHLCFKTHTEKPAVFTGDTLFVGGCGKFFEGDAKDMDRSLNSVLSSLPSETLVFCGHEYTVSNLKFAHSVEPNNIRIKEKLDWAKYTVKSGGCTVPSTIGDEKKSNPFMRARLPEMAKILGMEGRDSSDIVKELRERKNSFRAPK